MALTLRSQAEPFLRSGFAGANLAFLAGGAGDALAAVAILVVLLRQRRLAGAAVAATVLICAGAEAVAAGSCAGLHLEAGFAVGSAQHAARYPPLHQVRERCRSDHLRSCRHLGVRKSDVVRIGPRYIRNGVLHNFLPKKGERTGGKRVSVKLFEETKAVIAATPVTGTETNLVTSFGKPFTANGFGNRMREWCDNDKGDLRTAVRIYSELSNQGDRTAQLQLGLMYDEGHGVPKHYQQAVRWYTVAASQGDPEAPYYLGRIYQDGRGGPKNYGSARQWYRVAAQRENHKAAVNLGGMYVLGLGGPKDYQVAGQWFLLAANHGDIKAQDNLGVLYQNGEGVRTDYIKAYT